MLGLALALGAMTLFGFSALFMKPALEHMSKEQLLFFSALGGALVVLPFISPIKVSLYGMVSMLILTFFNIGALYFLYESIKKKGLGVSMPIVNSWLPLTLGLSMVFYNESLSMEQLVGALITFIGILLLSLRVAKRVKIDESIYPAFTSLVFFALYYFFAKVPLQVLTPPQVVFFLSLFVAAFSLLALEGAPKKPKGMAYALLSGALGALGFMLFNYSLSYIPLSLSSTIIAGSLLVAAGGGALLYGERISKSQFLGIALITVGLVLVSLSL